MNHDAMRDWAEDLDASHLLESDTGKKLLPGLTYDAAKNEFAYLHGKTLPRDKGATLDALRAWQDGLVEPHMIATMGGLNLKKSYEAWKVKPNDWNPFYNWVYLADTRGEVEDGTAAQNNPFNDQSQAASTYKSIFEKIETNAIDGKNYPPKELLPIAFIGSREIAKRILAQPALLDSVKTTDEFVIKVKDYLKPIIEARKMLVAVGDISLARFRGDTLLLENIKKRLTGFRTTSQDAKDELLWRWDTTTLEKSNAWKDPLKAEIEKIDRVIGEVKGDAERGQVNRNYIEK